MPRKVEFIESYIKVGNDYQWNDNHGELIRCRDCKYWSAEIEQTAIPNMRKCTWWRNIGVFPIDFCSRAERKETS